MKLQNGFFIGVLAVLLPALSLLHTQEIPRSPEAIEAERAAKELFAAGDYDKAVPILQRVLASDPHDLKDSSLLGMAYLYSSSKIDLASNLPRAQEAIDKVIADGGEAVFLVGRGDDPLKSLAVHMVKVIQGELRMKKGSVSFVPSRSLAGGVGPIEAGDLKECGLNRSYGKDSNAFHFKLRRETINFRPLHFSRDESDMVCALAAKYLGAKTVN